MIDAVRAILARVKENQRKIILVVIGYMLVDCVLIDRWQIAGRVVDQATGRGIPGAWVMANFDGEKPLVNLPIPPHPAHRTGACMGTQITRTTAFGWYFFDDIRMNRQLANKTASVVAFKPSWSADSASAHITSGLIAWPPFTKIELARNPQPTSGESSGIRDDLMHALNVVLVQWCGHQGIVASGAAMEYAISISHTDQEKLAARGACLAAMDRAAFMNASRHEGRNWYRRFESEYVWPFDCDKLQFGQ